MHAVATGFTQRRHADVAVHSLLVHSVTGLVQAGEERAPPVVGVVARGHARVAAHAHAERMRRKIQPAHVVIETDRFRRPAIQLVLVIDVERESALLVRRRTAPPLLEELAQKRRELVAKIAQAFLGHAERQRRLVSRQQAFIRRLARLGHATPELFAQIVDFLE